MFQKKFRSLEAFGKLLPDGLFDHSGTCKTDQRFRLCQDNISQHSKACRHAACCRVCEDRHIKKSSIAVLPDGHTGFCHLHQGNQALLHSGTAGTDIEDYRQLLLCGTFKSPRDLFPHDFSHTGHHETTVTDTKCHRCPFYSTLSGNYSLIKPCLFTKPLKLFFVASVLKGILFFHVSIPLHKALSTCDQFDPTISGYMEIISAMGTDVLILLYLVYKNRRFAGVAFTHQVIRHLRSVFLFFTPDIPDCFFEHVLNSH